LHRHDRERVPIASITKLMTVLLTVEHAPLNAVVTVSPEAAEVGESTVNLRAGERMTVHDLLEAALIQSANDAADALADYVGGGSETRFVAMMNARAQQLGLTDTHFVRPDGLDAPGHVSSARDVTRLAEIVMRNPTVRSIVIRRTATISGGRTLHTWNDLLYTFPHLIGVKTGHTSEAGWSEVAAARGRGVTIYATLLGSPSRSERNDDLTELLAWGLSRYRVVDVLSAGRIYATTKLPYGKGALGLIAPHGFVHVVRVDRRLSERIVAPGAVSLPVVKGQRLGEVRVYDRGRLLARRPLVAARSVSRPGLLGRAGWYAGRTARHVWGWFS
jgi:D-alanyl-D-alanine carboxypeptidase (penicillin-binding protein 5/6)